MASVADVVASVYIVKTLPATPSNAAFLNHCLGADATLAVFIYITLHTLSPIPVWVVTHNNTDIMGTIESSESYINSAAFGLTLIHRGSPWQAVVPDQGGHTSYKNTPTPSCPNFVHLCGNRALYRKGNRHKLADSAKSPRDGRSPRISSVSGFCVKATHRKAPNTYRYDISLSSKSPNEV